MEGSIELEGFGQRQYRDEVVIDEQLHEMRQPTGKCKRLCGRGGLGEGREEGLIGGRGWVDVVG